MKAVGKEGRPTPKCTPSGLLPAATTGSGQASLETGCGRSAQGFVLGNPSVGHLCHVSGAVCDLGEGDKDRMRQQAVY